MLPSLRRGCVMLVLLGPGCAASNEDHCVHKAIESDAWCAAEVPGKPFCSPCVAEQHGCVAERPNAAICPSYTPDSVATTGMTGMTGTAGMTGTTGTSTR